MLELGYRHFKPTDDENYCSWRDGDNSNSVPPGWIYKEESPAQTALEAFKEDGEEAFEDALYYWSSTAFTNGKTAFVQSFDRGRQGRINLSYEYRVRAVRLIQIDS